MNTAQKIILYSTLTFGLSSIEYCFYKMIINPQEVNRCGIVIDKKQPDVMDVHKHSANVSVSEFLYIKYDSGIEKQAVVANDFYRYNKGDRICFSSKEHGGDFLFIILGVGFGIIINAILVIFIIVILWQMIGGKSFKEIITKL